jgi:EAL domain-containing protein (putative c-di-GMP-specific phosphodiesterase class I)
MSAACNLVALVVEDDGFQRRTVARMLRSLGVLEVLEAKDGREGLTCMHSATPVDLVVCDLDMPEMDGMEFMRHLGRESSTAAVVISSAKDRSLAASVEKMALAYGVRLLGLMEKPVTLAGLEDIIARRDATEPQLKRPPGLAHAYSIEEIRHGIAQQQFEPFYQPKVALKTGQVVGMEALARWRHPEHGLVTPEAFISMLELSGDIDTLTLGMVTGAAAACRRMQERGFDLTVSVNLSLTSLADTTMADHITRLVQSTGLEPRSVICEITETAAMTEIAPALENLARLRMRGFGLSVDDFGTGFSSLRQLMRVPFTELKVDQSFVTGCTEHSGLRILLESSVDMARKLGITSVAEGVETVADWRIVQASGCDLAQGYFIARPMDEAAFVDFCLHHVPIGLDKV